MWRASRLLISLIVLLLPTADSFADPATRPAPATRPGPTTQFDPTTRPITSGGGTVGDLLKTWYAEGSAAGNIGDWYDNRDRGHSGLDLRPWPQLQKVAYTAADRNANLDWAMQTKLLPMVVFGNSSTSAGVNTGGSNVRMYYAYPHGEGLQFLYDEYSHNNIYIYPEHVDHRPGHNGTPNHGDLYPTNTPFLITSQGSSGSDQPFMHALPYTLAAFRPEVKKKLVETGLLMPTVQMIFRQSNNQLKRPDDYLTGKAHPSVFDGNWVDPKKMVQMAHDITLATIPPMVQLRVIKQDSAAAGIDFFEQDFTETLADTPAVIARIFRSATYSWQMIVSAEDSFDINHRPLTFTWILLQGDPARVKITPMNPAGSIVQIVVDYPERRPVQPGSPLESNRVDIGVFVDNGVYTSAPGFVTWYSLDNESRTYDKDGKLLEIGYGMGVPALSVSNWPAMFALLGEDASSTQPGSTSSPQAGTQPSATPSDVTDLPGAALLRSQFSAEQLAEIKKARQEYALAVIAVGEADQKRKAADVAKKNAGKDGKRASADAEAALNAANAAYQAAVDAQEKVLTSRREGASHGVRALVEGALASLAADPMFWKDHPAVFAGTDRRVHQVVANDFKRLIGLGIANDAKEWTPLRPGNAPLGARLTPFEQAEIQQFNDNLIADVLLRRVVTAVWRENYADDRLTAPKYWRDIYHYDASGQRTGWTRYAAGQPPRDFTADGLLILSTDAAGQPANVESIKYVRQNTANSPLKEVVDGNPTR
jgi:hypothetical protein